jgi:hypothetical protein
MSMRDLDIALSHKLSGCTGPWARLQGFLALATVWIGSFFLGPLTPLVVWWLIRVDLTPLAVILGCWVLKSYLLPPAAGGSPTFCRFYLKAARWFDGGASLHLSRGCVDRLTALEDGPTMICFHPHGILPIGFTLNGAVRWVARDGDSLPARLRENKTVPDRVSGVMAAAIFQIPVLRRVMQAFGSCTPATKEGMRMLMAERRPFGILPGGMEELAYFSNGEEHVYIKRRAGFIKYALQYGCQLVVAYTFGEADLFRSCQPLRPLLMWSARTLGCVVPLYAGCWWCPLLPRTAVSLNTVWGEVIELPRIEQPSDEDVAKWHAVYMSALQRTFETHKARFGLADRTLIVH